MMKNFFFIFFLNEMANLWVDGKKKAWAIESYRRTYPTTVTPAQVCVGLNLFFLTVRNVLLHRPCCCDCCPLLFSKTKKIP